MESAKRHASSSSVLCKSATAEMAPGDEVLDGGDGEDYQNMLPSIKPKPVPFARLGKRRREHYASIAAVKETASYMFCKGMMDEFMNKQCCKEFLKPVFEMWRPEHLPNYEKYVEYPMDFKTLKGRFEKDDVYIEKEKDMYWFDIHGFVNDFRLIFENCMVYNAPKSRLYRLAETMLVEVNRQMDQHQKAMRSLKFQRTRKAKQEEAHQQKKKVVSFVERRGEKKPSDSEIRAEKLERECERVLRDSENLKKKHRESERAWVKKEKEWELAAEAERNELLERLNREKDAAVKKAINEERMNAERSGYADNDNDEYSGMMTRSGKRTGVSGKLEERSEETIEKIVFLTKPSDVLALEKRHNELLEVEKIMEEMRMQLGSTNKVELEEEVKLDLCKAVLNLDEEGLMNIAKIVWGANGGFVGSETTEGWVEEVGELLRNGARSAMSDGVERIRGKKRLVEEDLVEACKKMAF